jgi:hypothetical protein
LGISKFLVRIPNEASRYNVCIHGRGLFKLKDKGKPNLTDEDKELLIDALLSQGYAYEVVDSELKDLEYELKPGFETRLRKLNVLLKKLHS